MPLSRRGDHSRGVTLPDGCLLDRTDAADAQRPQTSTRTQPDAGHYHRIADFRFLKVAVIFSQNSSSLLRSSLGSGNRRTNSTSRLSRAVKSDHWTSHSRRSHRTPRGSAHRKIPASRARGASCCTRAADRNGERVAHSFRSRGVRVVSGALYMRLNMLFCASSSLGSQRG